MSPKYRVSATFDIRDARVRVGRPNLTLVEPLILAGTRVRPPGYPFSRLADLPDAHVARSRDDSPPAPPCPRADLAR